MKINNNLLNLFPMIFIKIIDSKFAISLIIILRQCQSPFTISFPNNKFPSQKKKDISQNFLQTFLQPVQPLAYTQLPNHL